MSRQLETGHGVPCMAENQDRPLTGRSLAEYIIYKLAGYIYKIAEPRVADPEIAEMVVVDVAVASMVQYERGNWKFLDRVRTFAELDAMPQDDAGRLKLLACVKTITLAKSAKALIRKIYESNVTLFSDQDSNRNVNDIEDHPDGRSAEKHEVCELVLRVLSRLRNECRSIVTLRILERASFREIGELLNMPEPTAKTKFHRAMKRLRELAQQCHLSSEDV
jgi:RNA polymerase sigma factor (sigma-70 family)